MKRVLVTGANGFVGQAVCHELIRRGFAVTAAVRQIEDGAFSQSSSAFRLVQVGDLGVTTNWSGMLENVDAVIHLAARVHVLHQSSTIEDLQAYRQINVRGTENLARAAADYGVKRFVFLSSIKVNGESTGSRPFSSIDAANPQDPYAISKWEAEQALWCIADKTSVEVVVLRPPLIYGPGVKANFLRLMRLVNKGIPLPLALVKNRRSMIYLGNLVDALITSVEHPVAVGKTYLVSDNEDISTPELIHRISKALGKTDRLWPLPLGLLRGIARLFGKLDEVERLLGSLQVDSSAIKNELDWSAPYSMEHGLAETLNWDRNRSD